MQSSSNVQCLETQPSQMAGFYRVVPRSWLTRPTFGIPLFTPTQTSSTDTGFCANVKPATQPVSLSKAARTFMCLVEAGMFVLDGSSPALN